MNESPLKYIWDRYSDHIGKTIFHPQYFAKKYAWQGIEIAQKKSHGTILDIGCGRMPYKKFFIGKGKAYIGLDHPETAKMYHGNDKPDVFADAAHLPQKNSTIDSILMFMVLEHLPTPLEALKEANRVLKKNGSIILTTVQMYPIHDEPFDFFRYTRFGLINLFKQAGFSKITVVSQGGFFAFFGLSFNVFLFKKLLEWSKRRNTLLLSLVLSLPFYVMTIIVNIACYIPSNLESSQKSRFNISHVVFAK